MYNKVVVSQYYGNHKRKTTDTYISLFSENMIKIPCHLEAVSSLLSSLS